MPVDSGRYTPETLSRRRKLAEALMSNSMQPRPIGSHLEGLSQLANTAVGALAMRQADREEDEYRKRIDSTTQKIARALMGGRDPRNAEYTDPLMVQTTAEMFPDRDEAIRLAMSPEGVAALQQNPVLASMLSSRMAPEEAFTLSPGQKRFQGGRVIAEVEPDIQKSTDDMREYEFAKSQGYPGSFFDFMRDIRRAGATTVDARQMGTIPPGYRAIYDSRGQIERLEPIPGSPAASDIERTQQAESERRQAQIERSDLITQDIDRVLRLMETGLLPDTGVGAWLSDVPGTDAKAISSLLDTIKANIGFDELNRMRRQSPTGGALGNVTERELGLLQAVAGSLDQAQSPEQLRDNLNRLWNTYQDVIHGPGNGPPRRPLSFQQSAPVEADGWSIEEVR